MAPRVLIVEDDQGIRELLTAILVRDGYEVATVIDGDQAILAIGLDPYDAILLDLMMPRTDGYDVIRHVAANAPQIPIVIATAAVKSIKHDRIDRQVVRQIIHKPFDVSEVREAIAKAVRRKG